MLDTHSGYRQAQKAAMRVAIIEPMSEVDQAVEATQPVKKRRRKGCLIGCGIVGVIVLGGAIFYGPVLNDFYKRGMFDFILHPVRQHAYSATSEQNLKALYVALGLYHESEGQYPDSTHWMDAIENRINTYDLAKGEAEKKLIRPDLLGQDGKFGYAMNDAASGKYKDDIKDPKTPQIFESKDVSRTAHGDPAKVRQGLAIAVDGTILK